MRIKVKGRIELKEIHQVSEKVFEYLSRYGITETRDINFYFTIVDSETKEKVILINPETGEELDGWLFEDPNKKVAKRKSNIIQVDFSPNDETPNPA
ncbi:MAG: hypothetical protein HC820_04870 [Hydrococcus sp. RM1_1_31]|nr:hypothetical protein [Hydrococcus sp. RM1_1_31]